MTVITHSKREALYSEKLSCLRPHGYKSVSVDGEGRLVVEVDDSKVDSVEAALYRRVWGPEWPIVRSAAWRDGIPLDEQLLFTSNG